MKAFEKPSVRIRAFETEDVLTVSVNDPTVVTKPAAPVDPELPPDELTKD